MKAEKIVGFEPAYDKRNSDPNKDYGIHGMNLRFVFKGDKGATQFLVFTNWYLPHVIKEMARKANTSEAIEMFFTPIGADIGYHSKSELYDGQYKTENCLYTDGVCYYDGSSLRADEFMSIFLAEGDEAVWKMLEEEYVNIFGLNEYCKSITPKFS